MTASPPRIDYSGQKDFYDPKTHRGSVSVVGAGGIGSPTILGLARLGVPKIHVFDDDEVEAKNVTNQSYLSEDVGKDKAVAIAYQAADINPEADIIQYEKRVTEDDVLVGDIVISAVDSMSSRKTIFDVAKKSPVPRYLIDGRLGGELIVLHIVNLSDKDHVEYYLSDDVMFEDKEMESNVCTARTIIDVSNAVSALIIRAVRRILTEQDVEKMITLNMNNLKMTVM